MSFCESVISSNWAQTGLNQFKVVFVISNFWYTKFTIAIPIEIIPGQTLLRQIWQ